MTVNQLKGKLGELELWLKSNGVHPNYSLVLQDKQRLEKQLKERENESKL
ncbi:hypothetical protein HX004_10140 [Myroides sp. 1354]|nr:MULTISPECIES: hypothetical protein [unclassified Myroides]MDM1045248.1 hypothetical protein [Myroides sp. R163-1]MDM1056130.1 hypothetical protein [Myroides sp. 1354]MDM1069259.1 hypothetical protein [Myroides sp. 1372]